MHLSALALPVVLAALAAPSAAAQGLVTDGRLDGGELHALSLSDGRRLELLDLPDRVVEPLDIPLVLEGAPRVLRLEPYSLRSPDFKLLVPGPDGTLEALDPPPPHTVRGRLLDAPESLAMGSLEDGRLDLLVRTAPGAKVHAIQPLPDGGHALYDESQVVGLQELAARCGVESWWAPSPGAPLAPGQQALGGTEVSVCQILLDADHEYYLRYSSSVTSVVSDLEKIVAEVQMLYVDTASIIYEITGVIVRDDPADPYTSSDAGTLLEQFRDAGGDAPLFGIERDIAHLFTDKDLNGGTIGVAYLDAICHPSFGYGLSESRFTNNLVSRTALTAHELGHNWSAPHCDGDPDCAIMCAGLGACPAGIESFGNAATNDIISGRNNAGCLSPGVLPGTPQLTSIFPTFSLPAGGGVLELHGIDFITEEQPTVRVDGVSVPVISATETLVTVAIPAGVGGTTVDVQLANEIATTTLAGALRYEIEFDLGNVVKSRFDVMETERFYFDGVAGSKITAKLIPTDATEGLLVGLRIVDPEDEVVVQVEGTVAALGAPISLKKFTLPESGQHRVEVYAIGTTSGAYQLKTKVAQPKKAKDTLGVGPSTPTAVLPFAAKAGTLLKLAAAKTQKPKGDFATIEGQPAALSPDIVGLIGPDGPVALTEVLVNPKGTSAKMKLVELPVSGDYELQIGGADDTVGYAKVSVKLKPAKVAKLTLELEE